MSRMVQLGKLLGGRAARSAHAYLGAQGDQGHGQFPLTIAGHHPLGAIEVIIHQPPSLGRQRQEPEHVAAG